MSELRVKSYELRVMKHTLYKKAREGAKSAKGTRFGDININNMQYE